MDIYDLVAKYTGNFWKLRDLAKGGGVGYIDGTSDSVLNSPDSFNVAWIEHPRCMEIFPFLDIEEDVVLNRFRFVILVEFDTRCYILRLSRQLPPDMLKRYDIRYENGEIVKGYAESNHIDSYEERLVLKDE
jgi:hypothetical protein